MGAVKRAGAGDGWETGMKRGFAILIAAMLLAAPAAAGFEDAARAFDAGDYQAAVSEWRRLAEAGDAHAQATLGGLYLAGTGVLLDPERAAVWYRLAATQGHATAQLNLGDLYVRGTGVPRDLVEAYVWLGRAARQGRAWAQARQDEIAQAMTAEERAQADCRLASLAFGD